MRIDATASKGQAVRPTTRPDEGLTGGVAIVNGEESAWVRKDEAGGCLVVLAVGQPWNRWRQLSPVQETKYA